MRQVAGLAAVVAALAASAAPADANEGDLDATFGENGYALGTTYSPVLASQSDGSIILATDKQLTRLTSAGVADPTFGSGGVADPPGDGFITDVAVDGQDRILVGIGRVTESASAPSQVVRLTENGQVDASFSGDGSVPTGGSSSYRAPIAVTAAGEVATVGSSPTQLLVLDDSGSPKASFSGDGEVETAGVIDDIAVRPDGAVIVLSSLSGSTESTRLIQAFGASGTPVPDFAPAASGAVPLPQSDYRSRSISVGPDQAIYFSTIAAGVQLGPSGGYCGESVQRITRDGQIDPSYRFSVGCGSSFTVDRAGQLLFVTGTEIIRASPNGKRDKSFGVDGAFRPFPNACGGSVVGLTVTSGNAIAATTGLGGGSACTSDAATFRLAGGGADDADLDGVLDEKDRCPFVAGPGMPKGCRTLSRSISVHGASRKLIAGRMTSGYGSCQSGRIRLRFVPLGGGGNVKTRRAGLRKGRWKVAIELAPGRYRATAKMNRRPPLFLCSRAKSNAFVVG